MKEPEMNVARACQDDSCDANHCPRCGGHKAGWYSEGLCSVCALEEVPPARLSLRTILLSPEQIQDAQECKWLREATPEEAQRFKDEHPGLLPVDRDCRPYFHMTIDMEHPQFPPWIAEQVKRGLRIYRFWEKPQ